jgi:CBS-domain-containing membrane protein
MKASDVMVTDVISVTPDLTTREVARILLGRHISGVPVLDKDRRLVGVVSEGDLMRRAEIGTEPQRSWWLELFAGERAKAEEFVRAHAVKVADVMTTKVVTATEDTPLSTIAALLERHRIKRVPILRDGSVVGIVSRANLLQAFAGTPPAEDARPASDDQALRERVVAQIRSQPWGMPWLMTVTVRDGVVELWGPVNSEEQKRTIRVAAEATPGVRRVEDNLLRWPSGGAA